MNHGPVFIIGAKRTPQAKAGGDLKDVPPPYLATPLIRQIILELGLDQEQVDEVILGNTGNPAKYPNLGRVVALEAGLPLTISGATVHRNCASGMEAISHAFDKIALGRSELVFAGGLESMSQMPLLLGPEMTEILAQMMRAKSFPEKLQKLKNFRLPHLSPIAALEQGLTDPFCGLNMGETAEVLARELKISRLEQDEFANNSHAKAIEAQKKGLFEDEIVPIAIGKKADRLLTQDQGPRENSSVEKLSKLKPFFDRRSGTVTVGNSCPITDGGSMLCLASERFVKENKIKPLGVLRDYAFQGLEPERMGMGPLVASHKILKKNNLFPKDIDLFEMNEAFAAQMLGVLKGFKEGEVSSRFKIPEAMGEIDLAKLNVNGGAIALGHPVGSTGSRLAVSLVHEMKRRNSSWGLASMCVGGGQGGALLIQSPESEGL